MNSGVVSGIYQYPVKSFKGYPIEEAQVELYGIYGDRASAFEDNTQERKHLSGKQAPKIMGYVANYVEGENDTLQFPKVKITSPSGKVFNWEDREFIEEIKEISNRDITPVTFTRNDNLMAFDLERISIITESSLRECEKEWGKELIPERFRPNIILSVDEKVPFIENKWIGKRLIIGEVELRVVSQTKRCRMINVNPVDLEIDSTLLKTLAKINDADFGVYASIIKPGKLRVNDRYYVMD